MAIAYGPTLWVSPPGVCGSQRATACVVSPNGGIEAANTMRSAVYKWRAAASLDPAAGIRPGPRCTKGDDPQWQPAPRRLPSWIMPEADRAHLDKMRSACRT